MSSNIQDIYLSAVPVNKLSPLSYYIIRNRKDALAQRYGMFLYTFTQGGQDYARFSDLTDESGMVQYHILDEVSYGVNEWTFQYNIEHG
jgi:hypothetical protein